MRMRITFFKNISPTYTSELYKLFNHGHNTRRSNCRLQLPYRNTSYGHKALSFLGSKLWNILPAKIKSSSNINTFKHDIKKAIFQITSKERTQCLFLLLRTFLPNLFHFVRSFFTSVVSHHKNRCLATWVT